MHMVNVDNGTVAHNTQVRSNTPIISKTFNPIVSFSSNFDSRNNASMPLEKFEGITASLNSTFEVSEGTEVQIFDGVLDPGKHSTVTLKDPTQTKKFFRSKKIWRSRVLVLQAQKIKKLEAKKAVGMVVENRQMYCRVARIISNLTRMPEVLLAESMEAVVELLSAQVSNEAAVDAPKATYSIVERSIISRQ